MPSKSGISHTFAALLTLILAPLVKHLVSIVVSTDDLATMLTAMARALVSYPRNPFGYDTVTTVLYVSIVGLCTFLWGYAYHVSRHD